MRMKIFTLIHLQLRYDRPQEGSEKEEWSHNEVIPRNYGAIAQTKELPGTGITDCKEIGMTIARKATNTKIKEVITARKKIITERKGIQNKKRDYYW